ncbi:MAG: cysteine synthase family protein [Desulfobacteraceae bacterium]|nr:cysteine synthase family protein [Desulfobacteraceae bacterium]
MKFNNSLGLIENTPLIELQNILKCPGKIYVKAEFVQPGGSIKDRAALHIIKDAYARGKLKEGQPVVEMTSGNMGAGLAVVCNLYRNPFTAVMSEGNSPARAKMLESLGANVVLVPQIDGAAGQVTGNDIKAATRRAISLTEELNAFYVDQFNNPSSVSAHFKGTGPELWQELGNELTAFVAGVGSGGTYVGTSKFLKGKNRSIVCAAVEPEGAQILAGKPIINPRHNMQGIGYCIKVPHWEPKLVDHYLMVNSDEAAYYRRLLAQKEGLYVGFSAAANVCAAVKFIEKGLGGASPIVATILCDTGLKY